MLEMSGLFLDNPGLNFGTVSNSSRLNFVTVFGQSGTKFTGLLWAVMGLIFRLLLVHVCCFYVLLLKN